MDYWTIDYGQKLWFFLKPIAFQYNKRRMSLIEIPSNRT